MGIYSLNEPISELYGQFKSALIRHYGPKQRQKRRKTRIEEIGISDNDLWIACTALHYSLTVVSRDQDFPRMKQVRDCSLDFIGNRRKIAVGQHLPRLLVIKRRDPEGSLSSPGVSVG
ncbi:MAG: PIN domain-containing protein, partial [Nodosilinea sp.]